jgi:hypothetical protein
MVAVAAEFRGRQRSTFESALYSTPCCIMNFIPLLSNLATGSRGELLIESSANEHPANLLRPRSNSVQSSIAKEAPGRVVCLVSKCQANEVPLI